MRRGKKEQKVRSLHEPEHLLLIHMLMESEISGNGKSFNGSMQRLRSTSEDVQVKARPRGVQNRKRIDQRAHIVLGTQRAGVQ